MPRVVALVGPTAVGKTAVSVELAQALGAEIVSCDSMQVYRQMRLLTQSPTHAQRAQVQHHLIDCIEPTSVFSAGEYRRMAAPIINRLLERGKNVLVVGGTGLYLRALTQGLCDAPPADIRVREQLWSECQDQGSTLLYNRLRGIDSAAAARIHPNDVRRIVRALEVYALTGRPISSWWRQATAELSSGQTVVVGLSRDREALYQRIDERLLQMVYEDGVINEVRQLLRLPLSKTARQVHGLQDLEQYLAGLASLKDTITAWQQRVRNYAKRQMTWFRQTPDIHWVELSPDERPWETAQRLLDVIRRNRIEQKLEVGS
ncbi:MAG: tRNA (adenosine(37)-N6)-dimethylallyltransferase MiaA [Candidatus Omnitrophica bacterium]|nr:tRNA (adenosine(37)-N6)-dimethylallyltransferase MiaA [Candidatus Omnitrophota bacterium]